MDKISMREWVSSLEELIDNQFKTWKKESRIENGEAVQIEWQFEQAHIVIDVFWRDGQELVILNLFAPRIKHTFTWHGLNEQTKNRVLDRVGNLAQYILHPPIDPHIYGPES